MNDEPTFGEELVESAQEALSIAKGEAAPARVFVPIAGLPGTYLDPDPLNTAEFITRQVAVLDARRRQGMNLLRLAKDGRILRIAPDGTETDVTAELDREVERAQGNRSS